MQVGQSHTFWGNFARAALAALGLILALGTVARAEESTGSLALQSAFSGILKDDAQQDDVELTSLLAPAEPANAAQVTDELPPPDAAKAADADPVQEILKRIEALEKSAKAAEAKKGDAAKGAADKPPIGEWVDMSNDKWNVRLGGQFNLDCINWADHSPQIPADNYIEFRRLRLLGEATGYGVYDARIMFEAEPENGDGTDRPVVDIKDAYLTMNELPQPLDRWRIGNFFVPFGLEQVTNDTNNMFLERSIPSNGVFTADREVGVAFYNCVEDQSLSWAFGAFFDNISDTLKERIDDNQGIRVSGRVNWIPYYDEPSKGRYLIHTGAGVMFTDDADGIARFRARPDIHEGPRLIDTGSLAATTYTIGNLELAGVYGPFAVQSEAFVNDVNLDNGDQAILPGAYVHCSYFLTGENRIYERFGQHGAQFGRNVPYTNFFLVPGGRGWGAWELKARVSYLDFDDVDRGRYHDVTSGFNWYWTERVRVMFDWIHPITTADTTYGATNSDILGMRFDFNW